MLKVVQAFDRAPIAEIDTDDAAALERKLEAAERAFRDRDGWMKPHQRVAILRKLAANACMGSILTAAGFGWRLVGT